jgi:uncharacterized protein YeeX (DUF496 family)
MDLFESIVEQITSKTLSSLLTKERQNDILNIGKNWDFYNGDQQGYIKQYRGEDHDDYVDKDKPTFNYTKLIIDEYVSGVFGKPVLVKFDDDAHTKRWDEITQPISFVNQIPFMKQVQRIAEVSETCLIMTRWDENKKLPYFEDIRGEFISFIPKDDNPKEIGVLIISYVYDTGIPDPALRFMERVELWNDEKWEIWVSNTNTKQKEKVSGGKNPYGIIPGVLFKPEEDDNSFYGKSTTKDFVTINEVYNNLWTALMRISVFQSFSVMVVTSDNEIKIEVAPTRYLKIPEVDKADVKYITPDAKIEDVRKVLLSLKEDLQDFSRVPQSVFASQGTKGAPQSGYALKIKRIPIEEVWENRRLSYGPTYTDLIRITMHVDAVHTGNGDTSVFLETKPSVTFSSTVPGLSPQEQLISDQFDLRYNLITPVDLFVRKHPGIKREDARKQIEDNMKENIQLGANVFEPISTAGTDVVLENILDMKQEDKDLQDPEKQTQQSGTKKPDNYKMKKD